MMITLVLLSYFIIMEIVYKIKKKYLTFFSQKYVLLVLDLWFGFGQN